MRATSALFIAFLAAASVSLEAGVAKPAPVFPVPMVKLLVTPTALDGKRVRVVGYLGPDMRLYLTKEHALQLDFESALFVADAPDGSISKSACLGGWVELTAEVVQFDPGAFGLAHVVEISRPAAKNELRCWP
jgi:hypothetical protein